jgi:hypothetical protein
MHFICRLPQFTRLQNINVIMRTIIPKIIFARLDLSKRGNNKFRRYFADWYAQRRRYVCINSTSYIRTGRLRRSADVTTQFYPFMCVKARLIKPLLYFVQYYDIPDRILNGKNLQ